VSIRLYMDEHVPSAITEALVRLGVDELLSMAGDPEDFSDRVYRLPF
jgi:hypothetical protein